MILVKWIGMNFGQWLMETDLVINVRSSYVLIEMVNGSEAKISKTF